MGLLKAAILAVLFVILISKILFAPGDVPKLPEIWWRPGNEKMVDQKIRPFNVSFSKEMIEDLKFRLRNARKSQPPLANVGQSYGTGITDLPKLIDYWLNKYDFAKQERLINRYPQYITNIQGLNIHYVHVKPRNPGKKQILPLLLIHGWPGSFLEFNKVIPLLTTPREDPDFIFEVIVPSLPGYAYSDASTIPGLNHIHTAILFKNLMLRLGFNQFYVQGGDWGSFINNYMSAMFPQHVLGMHSNMCLSTQPYTMLKSLFFSFFPSLIVSDENYHLMYPLFYHIMKKIEHGGYLHIQSTKPDTIGVALSDSPVGLAAWILEKFTVSTSFNDETKWDDGVLEKYTIDELIDNLMMYWATNSITTSMRMYAESVTYNVIFELKPQKWQIKVPSACAQFPNEIVYQPEGLLKDAYVNLVRVNRMPRGGHFAAMEEPKLLADDIWESIKIMKSLERPTAYNS
ncbi:hypothetical protein KPH14_011459 [Odynerus spinipes]|uniref:Epoxide hydrolase n=1 Tax=Odynerus spinipes TaxID=1348599 RepID=A0AAD9VUJ8_9HYME|nr:hypothetical protein KPH14_011459 [Odynerus spinipes]